MPPNDSYVTYRVWGLPPNLTVDEAALILEAFFDTEGVQTEPIVHSLGLDPYAFGRNVEMVATVTFSVTPVKLLQGDHWLFKKRVPHQGALVQLSLTIDTTFSGFTPLNTVKDGEDHKIDCIVVSGLSSHPFGSWKQRGGHFMWLRDSTTWRSPGVRVLLYGYDTALVRSESFQDIDDIGHKLGDFITRIRLPRMGEINFEPRPIVFVAHSLGGLVIKEAICHMANADPINAQCIYGLIFFGVPNRGIRISHWLPMVNDQPNENLIRNLAPESHYLRNLQERFCRVFRYPTSRVVSVYETLKSKTAKEESPGRWTLTGKTEVLVTRDSALDSCPPGLKHNHMSMNQNHADLPKFRGPHDSDYQLLMMYMNDFWKEAVVDIQMRFGREGLFAGESNASEDVAQIPLETSRTTEPHPQLYQAQLQNNLLNQFLGNPYAFNLQALATGGHLPPNFDLRSLTPFGVGIPHRPRAEEKAVYDNIPDPTDAPPQYEASTAPTNETLDVGNVRPKSYPPVAVVEIEADVITSSKSIDVKPTFDSQGSTQQAFHICLRCNEHFMSRRQLAKHKNASGHHDHNETRSSSVDKVHEDPNTCQRCKDVFPSRTQLFKHLRLSGHDGSSTNDGGPLRSAVVGGHFNDVQRLLNMGADVDVRDDTGWTPLHFAAHGSNLEIVTLLLNYRANLEAATDEGCTPLHLAAGNGEAEIVTSLLDKGAHVNALESSNKTALHKAAWGGHTRTAWILLSHGAVIDAQDEEEWTPLHLAAYHGHLSTVKMLVGKGASIDVREIDDETPLFEAASAGHIEIVRWLYQQGADINSEDSSGWSPLLTASFEGKLGLVEELLGYSQVNARIVDHAGRTAIFLAACRGHTEIISTLLKTSRIDPRMSDIYGSTPLGAAMRNGYVSAVHCLFGATRPNVEMSDFFGMSLKSWAKMLQNRTINIILFSRRRRGRDIDLSDEPIKDEQPLDFCDVCTLPIPENVAYYECDICNGGNFYMCLLCQERGLGCLDKSHPPLGFQAAENSEDDEESGDDES